jgi:transcription initiation factor TFIIH subunit 4
VYAATPGCAYIYLHPRASTDSGIAKSIVMAMLYMPTSFPAADLEAWFKPSARSEREQALSILDRLHILASKREDDRSLSYSLIPGFQRSLRQALEGSGTHRSFGVPASKAESGGRRLGIDFLDAHAREQWESILFFMVSGAAGFTPGSVKMDVGPGTKKLLHAGDLVRTIHGTPRITKEGFSFVLQDTNAQVWNLLIIYLKVTGDVSTMVESNVDMSLQN